MKLNLAVIAVICAMMALFAILLGVRIDDSDSQVIRVAEDMAPWGAATAAIILAALTALYVAATRDMATATAELARETREQREDASRPIVVAELEADRNHLFWLVVRNIGNGVAREFRISCNPDLQIVSGAKLSSLPLFNKGLPILGPGAYIRTMLEFAPRILNAGVALQYAIRLSYRDDRGQKLGPFEYPIDFEPYRGLILGSDPLKDIEKVLQQIRDAVSK